MNERLVDPELLRSFIAIAETGSFTEAAERVLRTQSAVSMQMRRLEESLGRQFFIKVGRHVQLSSDGELLLSHARRLLQANADVIAAFQDEGLAGSIRVGAPDDYATTFIPPILAKFARTHPGVEVELICEQSARLMEMLNRQELDLALVTADRQHSQGQTVHREAIAWVGHAGGSAFQQRPLPLALFHRDCCFREATLAALAEAGIPSRIAYTSVSIAGILAAIGTGLAIGVMLRSTIPAHLRILGRAEGLPALPEFGINLIRSQKSSSAIDAMERHILTSFEPSMLRAVS